MSIFLDVLRSRPWLLADGATGTNYFEMGLQSGDAPEFWCFAHPERVRQLHRQFFEAGADIVLTNSFGANRYRLKLHDAEHRVRELNREAARLARAEADRAAAATGRTALVAGSMGPTGEIYAPVGPLAVADGAEAFAEQAKALAEGGADVLWIETISSEEELRAAVMGASSAGLPIVATMSFDTNGRTMMGITPGDFARMAMGLTTRPVAIGANCGTGAAELVASVLGITAACPEAVVVAKGNCGIPEFVGGHIHYSGTPEIMADYARLARDAGARIIGGCCGTKPAHLAAMRQALEAHEQGARPSVDEVSLRLGQVSALAQGQAPARAERGQRGERRRRRAH
ncbi:betaine--homocysteine S-methyltransferase [Rhodoligotrophos defluvii]|uniref:betaine--homocysteine S-methyltransferase n=1 Tax=Rhodoligotrophos defluvii TaxID=2561934 RepID=UPI0010C99F81|nr:betaine--homocysteine S-methyltransferase [Rhodoligotrophos defluvii]